MLLGGFTLLGFISLICMPAYIFNGNKIARKVITVSSSLFLLAAIIENYLLIVDGRYREFAMTLYALPVLHLSLGLWFFGQNTKTSFSIYRWLGILVIAGASVCLCREPKNQLAMIWLVISMLISWANWPTKRTINI